MDMAVLAEAVELSEQRVPYVLIREESAEFAPLIRPRAGRQHRALSGIRRRCSDHSSR